MEAFTGNAAFLIHCRRKIRTLVVMSHIAVERKRRRQMNEHLKLLRSLTPPFYIKRGDQASIIGGAIDFIQELHLLLHSLEAKKQRKSSITPPLLITTPSPPSPTAPSPKLLLLQPLQHQAPPLLLPPPPPRPLPPPPLPAAANVTTELELGACCSSPAAEVEAKISGSNVVLRTLSKRTPGQLVKIIATLQNLDFEVLHLTISTMDDTVLYSFLIKIGFECQLSVEDLALEVQQSFHHQDVVPY